MALDEDLVRIAAAATQHGDVTGVLAAEPARSLRLYLVALGGEKERRWVVLDDAGAVVADRSDVRAAASIVAMCELAVELGGGGADEPRVATPALLDELGLAAAGRGEPIADAIRGATPVVDAFVKDVEGGYLVELA
ncbi:MAG TPA: hypothetical protein VFB25_03680 [Gaiellaceae bacterium]|nr:hypothetical protein [Gaiellaceae bacterium]